MHNALHHFKENESLPDNLIAFYDEFLEFEGYCALLCDAMSCMAVTEMGLDDATQRGVNTFSNYLKQRVGELKLTLKLIQEKACSDSDSRE